MAAPGLLTQEMPDPRQQLSLVESIDRSDEFASHQQPAFDFDVAIVGLGYVGLPTALAFHAAGSRVLGVDVSERRLTTIGEQRADLLETDRDRLSVALGDPTFQMTSDVARLGTAAAVIICVPTPVDEYLVPDLRILERACATVVEAADMAA